MMSIFSPPSSDITVETRTPRWPTRDPTGSICWSWETTATFERDPASRAIAFISTTLLAISGVSSEKVKFPLPLGFSGKGSVGNFPYETVGGGGGSGKKFL